MRQRPNSVPEPSAWLSSCFLSRFRRLYHSPARKKSNQSEVEAENVNQLSHMTKEDFLKDPSAAVLAMDGPMPPDWIEAAWRDARFRDNITHELVRSVSKNGDFFVASYWLEVLPKFLTSAEVVQLFERIRDESGRLEFEWRPEFERAFVSSVSILPQMRKSRL